MGEYNNGSGRIAFMDVDEAPNGARPNVDGLSTAELVRRAYGQVSALARDELTLAKAELAEKGKKAGIGAGLFGAAGALAFFAVGCLIATAIIALSLVWPAWLAALSVGVLLLVIAGIAALIGRKKLAAATPPYPAEAVQGVTADIDTVKAAVHERSHRDH